MDDYIFKVSYRDERKQKAYYTGKYPKRKVWTERIIRLSFPWK